ncbi:MAG: tyrosine--tRNA ligase [Cyanobacteriota bacterium ELA615]
MSENLDWLLRGTAEIFPQQINSQDIREYIQQIDRPLRVKFGIDPTGSEIHLGHSIPIRKLRAFQDAGHIAVLIIGDFTAQIGDPTGKSEARRQLTTDQVKQNAQTYLEQLKPILDFDNPGALEIHYNSQWLDRLNLADILDLLSTMTVGQMLAKEGFKERYNQENPIFLHEFMYPLMQGYDSVAIEADVELGGTDQKFNIAVGRDLQKHFGKKTQFGLLLPILIGTDGSQKMSKSLNNYVALGEDPLSMYSKLEKIPDAQLGSYFELLTNLPLDQIAENPRQAQKQLALDIVAQYHGQEAAQNAQLASIALVSSAGSAADIVPEYLIKDLDFPLKLVNILSASGLCSSNNDGKRQIEGGAVKFDGAKVSDPNLSFDHPGQITSKVLQVGKKKFVRLI